MTNRERRAQIIRRFINHSALARMIADAIEQSDAEAGMVTVPKSIVDAAMSAANSEDSDHE